MKKTIYLVCALFLLMNFYGSCYKHQTKQENIKPNDASVEVSSEAEQKPEESVMPLEATNKKMDLPKNWPWRGVCMPSAHANYKDVAYLHSIGVNFIRIQLKSPKRTEREKINPTKAFYDELEWADLILDECKKYGMTSLIAFNYLVLDPAKGVDDKTPEFWEKKQYTDSVYKMVSIIANRYKNRGEEFSCYEIIGEPAIEQGDGEGAMTPGNIEQFYKNCLNEIRKVDQQRYFLVTPGPWGRPTNYAKFDGYKISDNKIIYGAHMYLPNQFTHQGIKKRPKNIEYPGMIAGKFWDRSALEKSLSYVKQFENKHKALIYIGEFQSVRWAPNGNQWVKDVASLLSQNGWGWTYFAYQPDFDFWNPYMEVENKKLPVEEWKLKNTGKESEIWQYMINNYFSKNKK